MVRISGVDLPQHKKIEIGLTSIFGIGRTSAQNIVSAANEHAQNTVWSCDTEGHATKVRREVLRTGSQTDRATIYSFNALLG